MADTDKGYWNTYARGARRMGLFYGQGDQEYLLDLMVPAMAKSGCIVCAYCLMSNHFHQVIFGTENELSRFMHYFNRQYSRYHNLRHGLEGHTFQGPFGRHWQWTPMWLVRSVIYVHHNPVEAGLVKRAEEYEWSSARDYLGLGKGRVPIDPKPILEILSPDLSRARRFYGLMEDQMARFPKIPQNGHKTLPELQMTHARWLLADAIESRHRYPEEAPEVVAAYWASERGIPPRAIAACLGEAKAEGLRVQLTRFRKRLESNPVLKQAVSPP